MPNMSITTKMKMPEQAPDIRNKILKKLHLAIQNKWL